MAGEELSQLCSEGGWTYGALWCNDWRDPRMLLLEGSYHEEQSGMIFEKVVNQVHVIGQGTVGEVALSGKHRWIIFDTICMESSELSSTHNPVIFQGIAEWQDQILAGIKTIAVIPLPSLAVLQFGSIQKIDESSDFIAQVQHLFWQFRIKQRGCLLADMNISHPQTTFDSVISSRDYFSSEFASLASGSLSLRSQIGSSSQTSSLKPHAFSMPESISSKHQIHNSFMNNPIYSCEQTTDQLNDGLFVPFPYSFPDVPIAFSESPAVCVASSLDQNCDRNVSEHRLVSDNDLFDGMEMSSFAGSGKGLLSDSRSFEQLLDAVVATKNSVICQDSKCDVEKTMQGPLSEAESNSNVYTWIDDTRSVNAEGSALHQPKKLEEHTKVVRKRARHGESTRPRPKDRQQIQDRVNELREIVPNGAKCSIDSLLDRTIKHMLFLQSVTKYVDKLKQAKVPKLISEKSVVVLKGNTNGVGGATWAYEVDGQTMACPIMVEDVYPSGQMLVEMLCEERGFFLEIADVVRGFGLTILKGDMEIRERKVWARFLVEANRYVTRMDIFLSLVQFMQQTSSFQAKELLASTIFSCKIC